MCVYIYIYINTREADTGIANTREAASLRGTSARGQIEAEGLSARDKNTSWRLYTLYTSLLLRWCELCW